MGTMTTNGTFFIQHQNGDWVKLGDHVEFTETEDSQHDVAFNIMPRTYSVTLAIRDTRALARLRRVFMRCRGVPRTRNLRRAARLMSRITR